MKQNIFKKTVLIPMISSIFTSTLLFADIEPNSSCDQSETLTTLDGAVNSTNYSVNGAIVGHKRPSPSEKPPYERDYYNFTPQSDGEITISYASTGRAYFRVGTRGCNSTNITSNFGKPVTKTFKVTKGQRVDFMTHCRYSNKYTIDVNFKSNSTSTSIETPIEIKPIVKKEEPTQEKEILDENLTFSVTLPSKNLKPLKAEYHNGLLTIDLGENSEPITLTYDGKNIVENSNEFSFDFSSLGQRDEQESNVDKESKDSDEMDVEPNNICSQSELITALDNVNGAVHYKNSGTIRVEGDDIDHQKKANDFYHFTPNMDGKLIIKANSNRRTWFAISNNGCHDSAWKRSWNLQRGSAKKLNKVINVKQDQEINMVVMSYSKKDYDLDIEFIPNR